MITHKRKIGIVGCGQVGISYAYTLLQMGTCDELVLIDINKERLQGEVADLSHAVSFLSKVTEIKNGDYPDLYDADIVLIAAGAAQTKGEDRMALLQRNAAIFEQIVGRIVQVGFGGIYLVATNPVDIMTKLTYKLSGAPASKVIGSGTILDTGRARRLLGDFLQVDPKNIHAYVIGEHGESEFLALSQATVGGKRILDVCKQDLRRFPMEMLTEIEERTRNAAAEIIAAKGATCYGIASALWKLTEAIYADDNSVFTLSCLLNGEYGLENVYIGVPAIVTRQGIREIITTSLDRNESLRLTESAAYLSHMYSTLSDCLV